MKTNTQLVCELMDHSEGGAMMQLFVLTAIERYAGEVTSKAKRVRESFRDSIIAPEAWIRCAEEAQKKITSRR